jgi:SAM-dependent methyltransferase
MKNPNDKTAKYYDLVYSPFKGEEVTIQEVKLIEKIVKPNSRILDVGCGTGRHIAILTKDGYEVMGIDSSSKMLEVASLKIDSGKLINSDIFKYDFEPARFDLVCLFWNAFNEMALDEYMGKKLFSRLISLISPGGKILVNCDDPSKFDPSKMFIKSEFEKDGYKIHALWQTSQYDENSKISVSREKVKVFDENGREIECLETRIKQRWWRKEEFLEISRLFGLECKQYHLDFNDELYLLFEFIM